MIVKPKVRGFICTTSHPKGCEQHVLSQINYIKQQGKFKGPQKVLIIGASTGCGLASRIAAAFGADAKTIGVFFEKPASDKRTASAGWYNTAAFEKAAQEEGLYAKSINGDAFSDDIKQQTIELIQKDWSGEVDCIIYSIASPRRTHPKTGELFNSALKPIGDTYQDKTVDVMTGVVSNVSIAPATTEDIRQTIEVMGGEDWKMWIEALKNANVLAQNAKTVAYSYIGPQMTYGIYRSGTIGKAKEHLEKTANELKEWMKDGTAYVAVNKCLVTQASSAIPVVPLYTSLLYQVMKDKNLHEDCIEQMWRLFSDRLYAEDTQVDTEGRIRMDDWEMRQEVQDEVQKRWKNVSTESLDDLSDIQGYRDSFYRLFGFGFNNIDYDADIDIQIHIPSIPIENSEETE